MGPGDGDVGTEVNYTTCAIFALCVLRHLWLCARREKVVNLARQHKAVCVYVVHGCSTRAGLKFLSCPIAACGDDGF